MSAPVRVGTRRSPLARRQSGAVAAALEQALGRPVELVEVTTRGDVDPAPLASIGGAGVFVSALREAVRDGQVDLAVHSLKDVPTVTPEGLELVAMLERADPRDALVSKGPGLDELPRGARVGTTSLRRQAQLGAARPDLEVADLRGNVDTRLRRLREGKFDAILLAMAGLVRLGRADEVTEALDPGAFVPAPGQGTIALECRGDDQAVREAVAPLHHEPTARAVAAERAFLATLGGGCNVPLGAHATAREEGLDLVGFVARVDGSTLLRGERSGDAPVELGRALARDLLDRGAGDLLAP